MKHFITTLFLTLCTVLTAEAQTATIGGIIYEVNDDNITSRVIGAEDASGDVTIPATVSIGGKCYSVTAIGDEAFYYCDALTSISIPGSVTAISNGALSKRAIKFSYYKALTYIDVASDNPAYCSVDGVLYSKDKKILFQCPETVQDSYNVPGSVTAIGDYAFVGCRDLTNINIPGSVTTIGDYAFEGCVRLTSINIPNSITTIGDGAFGGCASLTNIDIPGSVTTIGDYAFSLCLALTSIKIPASVSSIGNYVFNSCVSLTSIDVDSDNPAFCSVDGVLYTKDMKALLSCPITKEGHYDIPTGVTTIGEGAFSLCIALSDISIPEGVTTIGEGAFSWCRALTNINIHTKTPPTISGAPNFPEGVTIHVPQGCAESYRQAESWKNCKIIDDLK